MAIRGLPARAARIVAAILLVASFVLLGVRATPSSASTQHITTASRSQGSGLNVLMNGACSFLGGASVAEAADRLLAKAGIEGLVGAAIGAVFMGTVHVECPSLLRKGAETAEAAYRQIAKPRQSKPRQPTRSLYLSLFTLQSEAQIAQQITINGQQPSTFHIGASVNALCSDMRHARSPIPTFENFYPGATLDVLGAMDGVARLVISGCPLNGLQANALTSAILDHLLADSYSVDLDPPVVLMEVPTETRYTNGTAAVQVHYLRFDFSSGVKVCYIFIGYDGLWHADGPGTATLTQGKNFNFAVRCQDHAGNLSAWNVSSVYVA